MTINPRIDPGPTAGVPEQAGRLIQLLFDEDSFLPLHLPSDPSAATGVGQVNGRTVACLEVGPTTKHHQQATGRVIDIAKETGCPLILIRAQPTPGALSSEWLTSHGHIDGLLQLSGLVPIVAVDITETRQCRALPECLADFSVKVGPDTSEGIYSHEAEELTGACEWIQELLAHLPQNNCEFAPLEDSFVPGTDWVLSELVPANHAEPYDVVWVIDSIGDEEPVVVDAPGSALVTAFTRIGGRPVGVLASQPAHRNGLLGPAEANKATRFLQFCDAFNLPVLYLVDTPGHAEDSPDARRAYARLALTTAETTVPIVTVVLRRATGLAADLLGSKILGADLVLAWTTAAFGQTGLHHRVDEILSEGASDDDRARALEQELTRASDHEKHQHKGIMDQTLDPAETPRVLSQWFTALENKRKQGQPKKHRNLPL